MPNSDLEKRKRLLLQYSQLMQKEGLVVGPGGNTSIKDEENIMWISPSGIPFVEMTIDDFVPIDIPNGKILDSQLMPSSEVALHLFLYQSRSDINCIFHSHPPYVISLSSVDILLVPLFPDFVVYLGDYVPQVTYVTPCTEEMAKLVVQAMKDVPSCVLKNHGAVAVGKSIKEAYTRTQVLESGAQILFQAKLLGEPYILTKKDSNAILNLDIEQYRKKLLQNSEK
ncbi:MAG: class II aldolase/adducin family protein [Promethearchaeota archaeon]